MSNDEAPKTRRPRGPQQNLAQAKEDATSGNGRVLEQIDEAAKVCSLPGNDEACYRALDGVDAAIRDVPRAVRKRLSSVRNHMRRKTMPPKAATSAPALDEGDEE